MPTSVVPLLIVGSQKKARASETLDTADSTRKLYRTIGRVTYLIIPKPNIVRLVLKKAIKPDTAERLADLGTINEVFTLDIYANAATIPSFSDAACLEDILDLGKDWPFRLEHVKMFAADVGTPTYLLRSANSRSSPPEFWPYRMSVYREGCSLLAIYYWCGGRTHSTSRSVRLAPRLSTRD
jgi:hypothetical protein